MIEIITGNSFHYDEVLVNKYGLRPEFVKANQCMDANSDNRLTACKYLHELSRWYKIVNNGAVEDKMD
ncbi:16013_t:CDS:2 [Gigaspora margarita]|uniref:16013_t:CDS:1 n=1 Tax=Gigaspora margarita TaxID=4874 RepID=A0ABM8W062_GIGMA|nr:16013_t:CDS:2 [Gigaspora margarita]